MIDEIVVETPHEKLVSEIMSAVEKTFEDEVSADLDYDNSTCCSHWCTATLEGKDLFLTETKTKITQILSKIKLDNT
jgi:hypothetical protein